MRGRGARPVGQIRACVLARGDEVEQAECAGRVAPFECDAARILRPDQPALEGFVGKGDHRRRADRVETIARTQVIQRGDGGQIVVQELRAEAGQGLIFRAFAAHARVWPIAHLDQLAAADGARITEGVLHPHLFVDGRAANLLRAFGPRAVAPVAQGQVALALRADHAARRAEIGHRHGMLFDEGVVRAHAVAEAGRVGVDGFVPAAADDALDVSCCPAPRPCRRARRRDCVRVRPASRWRSGRGSHPLGR